MRVLVLMLPCLLAVSACSREPAPAPVAPAPVAAAADPAAVAAELDALLEQWHEAELKANPIFATAQGDLRYNDQLPDFTSEAFRAESEAREREGIDLACLRDEAAAPRTHDVLFSTVLGMMGVETAVRDPARDLLAPCRGRR